ncbi:MAG: hypothetical protein JW860_13775 [Sedimentisphaerales bacterium]|nr:hypothetical protein [Sedimentisphaerales bacterium]
MPTGLWGQESSEEPLTVTLEVTVVNATPGGQSVIGDHVDVNLFRGNEFFDTRVGMVDQESKVIFEDLPAGDEITAVPAGYHQSISFSGRPVALKPSPSPLSSLVHVYDVSADLSQLSVKTHHIALEQSEDIMQVSEYMRLKNSSSLAISPVARGTGEAPVVIQVFLPKGYRDVRPSRYFVLNEMVFSEEGFYDPMAVAPGEYDINFTYVLDIDSRDMEISKKFSMQTDDCILFLALPLGDAEGLGPGAEVVMADGKSAEYFSLGSFQKDDTAIIRLTGLLVKQTDSSSWIILIVVFGFVAVVVIWRMKTQEKQAP